MSAQNFSSRCNERCRIRICPGNSENDFRCRKVHAVLGNSDPTKHVYIKFFSTYQPVTMDILTKIGLYVDGKFMHPFFDPKRHMLPCNFNAKCNMSPVISDFFIGLKSTMNAQALDHTNGLAKYVCKYIGTFDDCNYIIYDRGSRNTMIQGFWSFQVIDTGVNLRKFRSFWSNLEALTSCQSKVMICQS